MLWVTAASNYSEINCVGDFYAWKLSWLPRTCDWLQLIRDMVTDWLSSGLIRWRLLSCSEG